MICHLCTKKSVCKHYDYLREIESEIKMKILECTHYASSSKKKHDVVEQKSVEPAVSVLEELPLQPKKDSAEISAIIRSLSVEKETEPTVSCPSCEEETTVDKQVACTECGTLMCSGCKIQNNTLCEDCFFKGK